MFTCGVVHNFVGETEWHLLEQPICTLHKRVGEIDPWGKSNLLSKWAMSIFLSFWHCFGVDPKIWGKEMKKSWWFLLNKQIRKYYLSQQLSSNDNIAGYKEMEMEELVHFSSTYNNNDNDNSNEQLVKTLSWKLGQTTIDEYNWIQSNLINIKRLY